MARKPKVGSRAWDKTLLNDPTYLKNKILALTKRAEGGDPTAVESLLSWLEQYPDLRSLVRNLDDLATKVERVWIQRLCGADPLAQKALEDDLATMKAELLGPQPSVADKIVAATVLVAHLDYQRAALAAAVLTDQPEVRSARARLLTMAQKRLHDAVKGWKLHAGKKAKGMQPKGGLKIFDPAV